MGRRDIMGTQANRKKKEEKNGNRATSESNQLKTFTNGSFKFCMYDIRLHSWLVEVS